MKTNMVKFFTNSTPVGNEVSGQWGLSMLAVYCWKKDDPDKENKIKGRVRKHKNNQQKRINENRFY